MLSNCPQVSANQVVNNKGVSIICLFGGASNAKSWNHPGGPHFAEGFGVPWFHLFLRVGIYANTAKEAIDLLTVGSQEYRAKTGRGSIDSKIAILDGSLTRVLWTLGNPSDWEGAWDEYQFKK